MSIFDTKDKNGEKKEGRFSKLILGLVVGGAVGSVVGVGLSDKEKRQKIKNKSAAVYAKGKTFFSEYSQKKEKIKKKRGGKTGFWYFLHRLFHGTKK